MQCSRCQNKITNLIKCSKCVNNFCSQDCLTHHNYTYHVDTSTGISDSDHTITNNTSQKILKESLLNTPSFNYKEIKYSSLYDLKNFSLIYKNDGKPKTIGSGSFGQVFLAKNDIDNKIYAIKHMEKKFLLNYFKSLDQIYSEINIQSRINHPNIIKLLFVKETKTGFDLVMEYAPGGTLFNFIIKNKGLSEDFSYNFFIQIVYAIKFLHENKIIHRDIKPENILLFEDNIIKLCDFGWAKQIFKKLPPDSFFGTVEYMSPEIINHKSYDENIDLWTLGILLYELMHSFSPFRPKKEKFSEDEVIENIRKHNIEFYVNISEECKKLILGLLEYDENKRYKMNDIINSDFIKIHEKSEGKKNVISRNNLKKNYSNIYNNNSNDTFEHIEYNLIKSIEVVSNNIKIDKNLKKNNEVYFFSNKKNSETIFINNDDSTKKKEFKTINTGSFRKNHKIINKYLREKIIITNEENENSNKIITINKKIRSTSNDAARRLYPIKNKISSKIFNSNLPSNTKNDNSTQIKNFSKDNILQKSNYEKIKKNEPSDNNVHIMKSHKSQNFQLDNQNKSPSDNMEKKFKKFAIIKPKKKIKQEPKDNCKNNKTAKTILLKKNITQSQLTGKKFQNYVSEKKFIIIQENQNKKPNECNKILQKEKSQVLNFKCESNRDMIINKILDDLQKYENIKNNSDNKNKIDKIIIDEIFNDNNKNKLKKNSNINNKIVKYKKKCKVKIEAKNNNNNQIKLQTSPDDTFNYKEKYLSPLENSGNRSLRDKLKNNLNVNYFSEIKKDSDDIYPKKIRINKGNLNYILKNKKNNSKIE